MRAGVFDFRALLGVRAGHFRYFDRERANARAEFGYVLWLPCAVLVWFANVQSVPRHRRILGQKVRLHRKLNGFTQEKLAEKADLAPTYISDIERGRENISIDAVARIAKALRVELDEMFREADTTGA